MEKGCTKHSRLTPQSHPRAHLTCRHYHSAERSPHTGHGTTCHACCPLILVSWNCPNMRGQSSGDGDVQRLVATKPLHQPSPTARRGASSTTTGRRQTDGRAEGTAAAGGGIPSDGHGHGIAPRIRPHFDISSACTQCTHGGPTDLLTHRHTPSRDCRHDDGAAREGNMGENSGQGKGTGGIGGERRRNSFHSRCRPSGRVKQRRTRGRSRRRKHIFDERRDARGDHQRR